MTGTPRPCQLHLRAAVKLEGDFGMQLQLLNTAWLCELRQRFFHNPLLKSSSD
jgi:hypothetical protein